MGDKGSRQHLTRLRALSDFATNLGAEYIGCSAYGKWIAPIMWEVRAELPDLHLIPKSPVPRSQLEKRLRKWEQGVSFTDS